MDTVKGCKKRCKEKKNKLKNSQKTVENFDSVSETGTTNAKEASILGSKGKVKKIRAKKNKKVLKKSMK